MDWCTCLELVFVAYFIIQLVRLVFADCDLQLQWSEMFGKSTGLLAHKVVWITGASSGIGEYLAYEMAKVGCRIVLSARRLEELQRVKKECLSFGKLMDDDIFVLPLDMLNFDKHKVAVDEVLARFNKIDILVNNAGRSQRARWENTELAVDKEMLEINVLSVLSLTKHVLPHMIENHQGHIVNMSSVSGKIGVPSSGSYSGTKHAIQGWFDSLRVELYDRNISVTNLCPGPVHSNIQNNSFSEKQGTLYQGNMFMGEKMSTARCARLCAVAIVNKLDEAWISQHPTLFALYLNQYCPSIFNTIWKRIGKKVANKMRGKE